MLFSMAKKPGSRRETKNINKTRATFSNKVRNSISGSSGNDSDSDSSLASDISRDTYEQPDGINDMNTLDHVLTKNSKNNKGQSNKAIKSEPKFDRSKFNLSSGTSKPLPVVTVSLRGGEKHRATNVSGITFLWDIEDTNSTIKR